MVFIAVIELGSFWCYGEIDFIMKAMSWILPISSYQVISFYMPHSRSLFNRAAVYQVTAMSFEETNLQDSDCTIPAAGGKD